VSGDIFDRIRDRVCSKCGGTASCHQLTSSRGGKTYRFTCATCGHKFSTSGLVGEIVLACVGVLMLVLSVPIMLGKSRDVAPEDSVMYGLLAVAAGLAFLAYVAYGARTARKNPEIT
jgi:hypothetical protein